MLEEREFDYLVGVSDPTDLFAFDEVTRSLKKGVELAVVNETEVLQAIDRIYRRTGEITGLARGVEGALTAEDVTGPYDVIARVEALIPPEFGRLAAFAEEFKAEIRRRFPAAVPPRSRCRSVSKAMVVKGVNAQLTTAPSPADLWFSSRARSVPRG